MPPFVNLSVYLVAGLAGGLLGLYSRIPAGTMLVLAVVMVKWCSIDLPTAYIATSPGGMSALVSMAVDMKVNPTLIAGFHFFRIFLVILTAPAIFKIILIIQENFSAL